MAISGIILITVVQPLVEKFKALDKIAISLQTLLKNFAMLDS